MNITLQGKVLAATGTPIGEAVVQLIGREEILGADPRATTNNPTSVSWTRKIGGFTGNRWNCWQKFVAQEVSGITWNEFAVQALAYNPSLNATGFVFESDRTYVLPENRLTTEEIEDSIQWDRGLTGFFGNRWQCWTKFVQQKVVGLTWHQFADEVVAHNPQLIADGYVFRSGKTYQLPHNAKQKEYVRLAVTDANGSFKLTDLPQGNYRLEIRADGFLTPSQAFRLDGDSMSEFRLSPIPVIIHIPDDFVQARGTQFFLKRQPFSFVGMNIRGLVHYGDNQAIPASQASDRRVQLLAASAKGARVVRCFLANRHVAHNTVVDQFRTVLTLIKQEFPHIYVLPALTDLYDNSFGHPQGDDKYYTVPGNHTLLNKAWFSGKYKENYLKFVEMIVNNFKDEPNIFAWEIGNELKLDNEPDLFIEFNHAVASRIRALDSKHLITTGMISTRHAYIDAPAQKHELYSSPNIDFITNHAYNGEFLEDDSALAAQIDKPLILEEAGFDAVAGEDRGARVAENLQAWFGRGARGYLQWGFMAGNADNGDGDRNSGMDAVFHTDWDSLSTQYKMQADRL